MTGAQKDPQILLQRGTEGYELIAQTAPFPTSSKSQIESQGPLRIIHHTLLSVTSSCSTACRMMRLLSVVRATCILVAIALVPMSTCHKGSDVISWQYEVPRRLRGRLRDQLSKLGSDINVTGRIVGGDVVGSSERFPYYVALLNSKYSHVCGGSLIAPDAVLTAAHCKEGGLRYAVIGQYSTSLRSEYEIIPVRSLHPHELFGTLELSFDHMVVMLTSKSKTIKPVTVNLDSSIPKEGDLLTIMGFGKSENGFLSSTLKSMDGDYITNSECNKRISNMIEDDMVCMTGRDDSQQCNGDSGSPWIIPDPSGNNNPENDLQVATVSWGVKGCVLDKPGVGTRTTASDLITRVTCAESMEPPSYFGCPNVTASPSAVPLPSPSSVVSVWSATPSSVPSDSPSSIASRFPTPVEIATLELTLYFDPFPQEISWLIKDAETGNVYKEVPPGTYVNVDHAVEIISVPRGSTLVFVLKDTAADGIMGYGHEFELKIVNDDGDEIPILEGDGNFGGEVQKSFSVPSAIEFSTSAPVAPTISPAPTSFAVSLLLTIWMGHWHEETSWRIVDSNDEGIVYEQVPYGHYKYGDAVTEEILLPPGHNYTLIISDYSSDGIESQGYRLWKKDGNITIVAGDGNFGSERRHSFWLDMPDNL